MKGEKIMNIIRSQKGNTFIIAIMVLVISMVIGLTFISLSLNGTTRNVHREKMNQATVMAEDGISHITLQINKELEDVIQDVIVEAEDKAKKLNFMKEKEFKESFIKEFDKILEKYSCDGGTHLSYDNSGKKYDVCYDKENPDNKIIEGTYRIAHFKSIGTADNVTETLISGVKLGAVYSNYPKVLNYAVSTNNGGNLLLNGGITINGDVKADGNIIISEQAYLPRLQINRRWIDSTYPSISGETVFPSESKNAKLFVNPSDGRLFAIKSEALNNWKGCNNKIFDRVDYEDVYEHPFNEMTESNCLYDIKSVKNVTSYLFNKDHPDILETGKVEPFDVESMVNIGKKLLAKEVIKNDGFYSLYTRGDKGKTLNKKGAAIVNESYYATEPKWFKLGIQTIALDFDQHQIHGAEGQNYFRVTAPLGNNNFVDNSKYTLDGNFHFYGSNVIITGLHSRNTFKGNYYFSNKMPNLSFDSEDEEFSEEETNGIARASIRIEDGKHTFDGNFYLDSGKVSKKAININRGEHTFKGTYFVDGDIEINGVLGSDLKPAIIYADAVFFVNGNVDIDHTLIKSAGPDGKLIIFATGDISYNYATSRDNRQDGYFNEQQEEINMFLYSQNGKIELHGTVSNYKINGGVAANNVYLTALRGSIDLGLLDRKKFPTVKEQEKSESRLIIDYDETIVTTFNKLQNIGITYHDLDSFEPITLSRELQ